MLDAFPADVLAGVGERVDVVSLARAACACKETAASLAPLVAGKLARLEETARDVWARVRAADTVTLDPKNRYRVDHGPRWKAAGWAAPDDVWAFSEEGDGGGVAAPGAAPGGVAAPDGLPRLGRSGVFMDEKHQVPFSFLDIPLGPGLRLRVSCWPSSTDVELCSDASDLSYAWTCNQYTASRPPLCLVRDKGRGYVAARPEAPGPAPGPGEDESWARAELRRRRFARGVEESERRRRDLGVRLAADVMERAKDAAWAWAEVAPLVFDLPT